MKTRTWHNVLDRSTWARGPWDDEPDKMQWADEATGLPCLAVRHPMSGHWSGYVGVRPGHPLHGAKIGDDGQRFYDLVRDLDVHGGVNCGTACKRWPEAEGGIAVGICHEPDEGEPDDLWWLGFDAMHAWLDEWPTSDLVAYLTRLGVPQDGNLKHLAELEQRLARQGEYRTIEFIQAECTRLAAQLAR